MAGEPITPNKLVKPGQGGVLAAILPAGMRAISTKIDDKTSVGRLILPNDHVDVILVRRMRGRNGQEEFANDTLFRNVRVLAIGQQIETREGKKASEAGATTATLELTPRQAEMLALANSMGELTLALRSIADLDMKSGPQAADDLNKPKNSNAIEVLRYGVRTRVYGVN
jgi:pilus assembly protein CpaB